MLLQQLELEQAYSLALRGKRFAGWCDMGKVKITKLFCDRCGNEIMPLSNDNPEYLMTSLYIKKNQGVIGVSGNAGGIDEKQIDLCKECTCKLNHFLSSPDVTETSTTRG